MFYLLLDLFLLLQLLLGVSLTLLEEVEQLLLGNVEKELENKKIEEAGEIVGEYLLIGLEEEELEVLLLLGVTSLLLLEHLLLQEILLPNLLTFYMGSRLDFALKICLKNLHQNC